MKKVQSTCNYCSLACNIDFMVEDETIKKSFQQKGILSIMDFHV
ncbi:hypothetical protein [Turicibacter sanguinis]|nr:hypothetical protein [Turicibacter sanguinis]